MTAIKQLLTTIGDSNGTKRFQNHLATSMSIEDAYMDTVLEMIGENHAMLKALLNAQTYSGNKE